MKRLLITAAALAVIAAAAGPAAAQQTGLYSGTSADGNALSFTIGTDPNNGKLALTSFSVGATANCSDGTVIGFGTGFTGLNQDVSKTHTVHFDNGFIYDTEIFVLTFSSDKLSATGTISSITPALSPAGPHPKKAVVCRSKPQSLGLTFQHAAPVKPVTTGPMSYFTFAPH